MNIEAIAAKAIQDFRAAQHLPELIEFLEWLKRLAPAPQYVVEIGVATGGNLWAMQQVFLQGVQFIGVDQSYRRLSDCPFRAGTILVCGKSQEVDRIVRRMYLPEQALVYIDANHGYKQSRDDAIKYPASYQVFHDVKDTRRAAEKRLVCHFFEEHRHEFVELFTHETDRGGIGIRKCSLIRPPEMPMIMG